LARELLHDALVVPATVVIALAFACMIALALAWSHRGFRWWYFVLLVVVSGAITQFGRAYLTR
jgi:hypothetical protein